MTLDIPDFGGKMATVLLELLAILATSRVPATAVSFAELANRLRTTPVYLAVLDFVTAFVDPEKREEES